MVAVAGVLAVAFFSVFFALCFLALCFGAVCSACADGSLEDGTGAASAAQAGTAIKANNSNKFFMVIPLLVKDSYGLPYAEAARQQQTTKPTAASSALHTHQTSLSLA